MAVRDDIREQWEKQKGRSLKHRLGYFMHYYLIWVLVIAGLAIFAAVLIHSQLKKKPLAYQAEMINTGAGDQEAIDGLIQELAKTADIDISAKTIEINAHRMLTPGGLYTQQDIGSNTAISAEMMKGSLDAMVCDEWNFRYYVNLASFCDLRKVLGQDQLEKYKDQLYYVDITEVKKLQKKTQESSDGSNALEEDPNKARKEESLDSFEMPDPNKMDDPVPVGIVLTDSPYFKKNGIYKDTVPVFGIVNNSRHIMTSKKLLDLLMD